MTSVLGRAKTIGMIGACTAAGLPSTLLVPLPLTLALTRRHGREDLLRKLHRMIPWARFCSRRILKVDLDVIGRNHLPSSRRGHMFICNHQSYADILVLMDALDTVAFLAKSTVKWFPVLGICAYAGGSIFVSRNDKRSRLLALRETVRMCKESTAVLVFPEGTRSDDGNLRKKFHRGAINACRTHGLKLIPVGLDGTSNITPKSNDQVCRGQRVAVTIGRPMDPADYTAEEWVSAAWSRVDELMNESRTRLGQASTIPFENSRDGDPEISAPLRKSNPQIPSEGVQYPSRPDLPRYRNSESSP